MNDLVAHAEHGASSAYRWLACPGSVALSRGIPEKTSPYAIEGTAAHALAEVAYAKQRDASFWVGLKIEGIEVTEEMAEAVQVYLDHIASIVRPGDKVWIEKRVTLDKLNPPRPMFGTADCTIYRPSERRLYVCDYKHGVGVAVEAVGNPQLRYYALGALLSLSENEPCEHVDAYIVQPRAQHPDGPIRADSMTTGELLDFAADLVEGVERTLEPDAPLNPGSHCRFCKAAAVCPAKRDQALELAQAEFGDAALPKTIDPRAMTIEQVSNYLSMADQIEDWLRALRVYVQNELESGGTVPGWKLVNKRATRVWSDQGETIRWAEQFGLAEEELYDRKIKSPAQLEKVVGKKNLPKDLVSSVSTGFTLARETDKRPAAIVAAGEEFAELPADKATVTEETR